MMWEAIGSFIKSIIEKRLFPAIIAFLLMIMTYYLTGKNNLFLVKIGKTLFLIFFFGLYFTIIEFIVYLRNSLKQINLKKELNNKEEIEKEQKKIIEEKNILEEIWDELDKYLPQELNYVTELLDSNNKPLQILDDEEHKLDILDSYIFNNTLIREEAATLRSTPREIEQNNRTALNHYKNNPFYDYSPAIYLYKLKDEYFEILKISKQRYGRISHFY
jgi:hypothetical protein